MNGTVRKDQIATTEGISVEGQTETLSITSEGKKVYPKRVYISG